MAVTFEAVITVLVYALGGYALGGFLFALAFVTFGVAKVDPAAAGSGIFFRILIIPGTVVFWPMLLRRWRNLGAHG